MSSTTTQTVKEKVEAIEGKKDERKQLVENFIKDTKALNPENNTYQKQRKNIKNKFLKEMAKIDGEDITQTIAGKKSVIQEKGDAYLSKLAKEFNELSTFSLGSNLELMKVKTKQSEAAQQTHEKLAKKVEQATDKQETKEETKIIKEDIKEGMMEGKTAPEIAQDIKEDITYTYEDEKKIDNVINQEMKAVKAQKPMNYENKQPKPERKMRMETKQSEQRTGGTQTEGGSNFSESKIEISKVSETEQIRRQEEMPMDFSVGGISGQRLKEGKTTLKQLQDEMPQPIQKPAQLLQWINKVGGYENYVYLRSKFGLTEDIQGSMEYLQEIEKCLVNLYGGDLGVGMANYSNELQLKQCIRELNIMKNCLYISKFKASVGPQYGLVIGLNKVMSLADMLGKAPPMPQSSQEQLPQMTPNKPVVKGQERIEYEEQKNQLVEGLPQQPQRGRRLNVANPEISPDVIQESNLERGTKSQKIAPSRSIHEMVMQGQTPTQQQAMTISRGIKLMKARKQF